MTSFYAALAATASRLLRSKGQAMLLVKSSAAAYDPATSASVVATTTVETYGAVFDKPDRAVGGTEIERADKKVMLESSQEPQYDDSLLIGGVPHAIMDVQRVAPSGVVVLYLLIVRAGG